MREESVQYRCEVCRKKVNSRDNSEVVNSLTEGTHWRRMHVVLSVHRGMHNDGKVEQADLCKPCAIKQLQGAIAKIKSGKRFGDMRDEE